MNNNICYAVTYFVRKVLDVYVITTKVTAVTFQVTAGNFVSPVLTPAQIGQLPAKYKAAVEAILKGLPPVGETVELPAVLTVPTDGVVYDPELAHCCALDPGLEQAALIKLEREQAEAQKIGLEIQLLALEVQRRQALLAAGTLDPVPDPFYDDFVGLAGRRAGSKTTPCSELEAIADFAVDLARVIEVKTAEGQAVVEQDAIVRYVGCGDRG